MPKQGTGQWKKRPNQQDGASGSAANKKRKYFAAGNTAGLPLGSRGFLISCLGGKEQQSAFEASRLLQEYFDAALPKSEDKPEAAAGADLGALLAAEVQDLKSGQSRLFSYVKTNVNGLLYLQMQRDVEGPGPTELVLALARDVERTRQCKSRLCVRFTPVEYVVQGSVSAMKALAKDVMPQSFPADASNAPGRKFALQYEHRASVKLDRKQVIDAFVDEIPCPPYKVDLERPDSTILVQVVRNSAAVAVVPQYWQLRKFNIRELAMSDDERAAQEAANAAARGKQAATKPSGDAAAMSSGADADAQGLEAADAAPDAAGAAANEQSTAAAAGDEATEPDVRVGAEQHGPPVDAPPADAADALAEEPTSPANIVSAPA